MDEILACITKKMSDLSVHDLEVLVKKALEGGIDATKVLQALNSGMELVGKKYEASEFFLSELVLAGNIMSDLTKLLEPKLAASHASSKGTLIVGTVKGDIHDLGKNIFAFLAKSAGFAVSDLGVDVEPAVFVEKVQEMRPHILGMSALMSTTQGSMDETVRLLREVGLRSNLKVILGGAVASQRYANEIGADQAVNDAVQGVDICNSWVKPLKS